MRRRKKKLVTAIIIMLVMIAASFAWLIYRVSVSKNAVDADTDLMGVLREGAECVSDSADNVMEEMITGHVYSHRGVQGSYEHSYRAYDEAIAAGSRYIEQDLVMSSDGVLFVAHDLNASGMTGVNANYASMKAEDIDKLETKSGDKVLRLSEVFDRYGRTVNYVIELKSSDSEMIDAFESIVEEYGFKDIVIVQSMDANDLRAIEEKYPEMQKLLVCKTQQTFESGLDMSFTDILSVWYDKGLMTEKNCIAAHDHDKLFGAWTISSELSIKQAIDIGVDNYFTNDTALAISLEKEYGLEHRYRPASDQEENSDEEAQ